MSILSDFIQQKIKDFGLPFKQIGASFCEKYEQIGDGKNLSPNTIPSKLSKLEELEGERFFFGQDEARVEALAFAIGVSVKELQQVYEHSQRCTTLLLDPRLPEDFVQFLRSQEQHSNDRYRLQDITEGEQDPGQLRAMLRDKAKALSRAIVVTIQSENMAFYEGGDVRATTFDKVPRGWSLLLEPDLVPIPSPPPPRLRDEDGTPMIPHKELAEKYKEKLRHYHGRYWGDDKLCLRVQEAIDAEGEPTFTLSEVLSHGSFKDIRYQRPQALGWPLVREENSQPTYVWLEEGEIFALGPKRHEVEALFSKYHAVKTPNIEEPFKRTTHLRNPWLLKREEKVERNTWGYEKITERRFSAPFQDIAEQLRRETGFDCDELLMEWAENSKKTMRFSLDVGQGPITRHKIQDDKETREPLVRLLSRPFEIENINLKWLFLFEKLCSAPVINLSKEGSNTFQFAVYVGGGWVWRLLWVEYEEEESPIQRVEPLQLQPLEFMAKNLRLWLYYAHIPGLGPEPQTATW